MGRPIRYAPNEVRGMLERARTMIQLAPEGLADVVPEPKAGFTRFMRREPLGVVLDGRGLELPVPDRGQQPSCRR